MKNLVITFAIFLGSLNLFAQDDNQVVVDFVPCQNCFGVGGTVYPYFGIVPCPWCSGRGYFPIYRQASYYTSGSLSFYNKHYTAISKYVHVTCETGANMGDFQVYLSDSKYYIRFPRGRNNYVEIKSGKFIYGANMYYYK